MAATVPILLPEYRTYVINKGVTVTVVSVTLIIEFWLAAISTFGALYEADYVSVYFTLRKKDTPEEARR